MHRLFGAPNGHWWLGCDLARAVQRGCHGGGVVVEHRVDQTGGLGPLSAQAPAGVGQLLDQTQGHELGQALQRAHVGHHANVDFLDAKERIG